MAWAEGVLWSFTRERVLIFRLFGPVAVIGGKGDGNLIIGIRLAEKIRAHGVGTVPSEGSGWRLNLGRPTEGHVFTDGEDRWVDRVLQHPV